jgi:undecaprenyl-diphosphatase
MTQAIAIIPGISRSGSTISMGMYLKISPLQAARFSFLLSVPVITGATLLKTKEIFEHGFSFDYFLPIFIGTVVSFGSGFFAIKFLLRIVERGKFSIFAYYCLFVGTIGIIFL